MTLWFLARAAGFVALLAATLTVALGATGAAGRRSGDGPQAAQVDRRVLAQLVHRSTAVLTLAFLTLHAVLLITDHFVSVSVSGALVPFTAGYRAFALGLGTLAVYGFSVVAATGALRGRAAGSLRAVRAWRPVHLLAYLAWGLAMTHGLLAGTDSGQAWASWLYVGCGGLVAGAVALRVAAAVRHHESPLPTARRWVATSGSVR